MRADDIQGNEMSLSGAITGFLGDTLGAIGYLLDTPGALARGAMMGDFGSRRSGEELLQHYGMIGANDPNAWEMRDFAGPLAEILLDPLNLGMIKPLITKAAMRAGVAAENAKNARLLASGAMPAETAAKTRLTQGDGPFDYGMEGLPPERTMVESQFFPEEARLGPTLVDEAGETTYEDLVPAYVDARRPFYAQGVYDEAEIDEIVQGLQGWKSFDNPASPVSPFLTEKETLSKLLDRAEAATEVGAISDDDMTRLTLSALKNMHEAPGLQLDRAGALAQSLGIDVSDLINPPYTQKLANKLAAKRSIIGQRSFRPPHPDDAAGVLDNLFASINPGAPQHRSGRTIYEAMGMHAGEEAAQEALRRAGYDVYHRLDDYIGESITMPLAGPVDVYTPHVAGAIQQVPTYLPELSRLGLHHALARTGWDHLPQGTGYAQP